MCIEESLSRHGGYSLSVSYFHCPPGPLLAGPEQNPSGFRRDGIEARNMTPMSRVPIKSYLSDSLICLTRQPDYFNPASG